MLEKAVKGKRYLWRGKYTCIALSNGLIGVDVQFNIDNTIMVVDIQDLTPKDGIE